MTKILTLPRLFLIKNKLFIYILTLIICDLVFLDIDLYSQNNYLLLLLIAVILSCGKYLLIMSIFYLIFREVFLGYFKVKIEKKQFILALESSVKWLAIGALFIILISLIKAWINDTNYIKIELFSLASIIPYSLPFAFYHIAKAFQFFNILAVVMFSRKTAELNNLTNGKTLTIITFTLITCLLLLATLLQLSMTLIAKGLTGA